VISSPYRVRLRPKLSNHLFRSNQLTPTWWCCSVSPPCVLTNPLFAPRGGAPDVSAPLAGHPFQGPLDHSARKFRVSSRLVSVSLSALSSCSNSRTRACVVPSSCYSSRTRAPGLVEYPVHPARGACPTPTRHQPSAFILSPPGVHCAPTARPAQSVTLHRLTPSSSWGVQRQESNLVR
jgi:hypothetical protein